MNQKIVLWGRESSANVQKPLWLLEELGLDYERRDVGGKFGGLDTPEYAAMNPNRLVPVLQHGELTLWESHAIIRYLGATFGAGSIWPENPVERAEADRWTDWTASTFQPAWIAVFWLLVRTPPSKRDKSALDLAITKTNAALAVMDMALARNPFLAGKNLTYADIAAGVALYRWFTMDMDRAVWKNVEAWYARLQERPAFMRGACISYEDLVAREVP